MERVSYHGWQNVYRMTKGTVELLVLADGGPRILHYGFAGKRNEFQEFCRRRRRTGDHAFLSYGGHRRAHTIPLNAPALGILERQHLTLAAQREYRKKRGDPSTESALFCAASALEQSRAS
jgi:hypothetical protein